MASASCEESVDADEAFSASPVLSAPEADTRRLVLSPLLTTTSSLLLTEQPMTTPPVASYSMVAKEDARNQHTQITRTRARESAGFIVYCVLGLLIRSLAMVQRQENETSLLSSNVSFRERPEKGNLKFISVVYRVPARAAKPAG